MMEANQARFLLNWLVPQLEQEIATTRKVLAAVPADKGDYRPHQTSKSALELAWHLASSDWWFLDGILNGQFRAGGGEIPREIRSPADVASWYDKEVPPLVERLKALTDQQLARPISLLGVMELPAVQYLLVTMLHSAHHRGQLSSYLRPMGAKVPAIYGSSADEQPAAGR